uniref:DDE-1 domain-containing protein n=1 Tax=Glossina austeni TaxID=7395 RepID=A0A1A9VDM3_GLOAU
MSAKTSSYIRDAVKEKMEKALVMWIEDKSQKRIPVDGIAIKQTALRLYKCLKEVKPSHLSQNNLNLLQVQGETASADELAAKEFPEKLGKIIEDGGYTTDQVWRLDESGLFWKKIPSRIYVSKSQKTAGGFKVAKDRVKLLFCSNASGERMLKPLLVNRALRPRSMKGADFNKLPIHWTTNKKAWMTFTEWCQKYFIPEPECVKSKDPDPDIHNNAVFTDITTLAHTIGEDGFDDLTFADIEELLVDKSLSENEIDLTLETHHDKEHSGNGEEDPPILNATLIKEGLDIPRKLGNYFEQHDPDEERAAKFQYEVKSLMASFREPYNGLSRNQTIFNR